MHHRDMRKIFPADSGEVLLNPGMGYLFLQRGHRKVRFDELAPGEWFLSRPLSDKIIFDVAWSVVEPEEGRFDWESPAWEGCMQSWIDAGFKVGLQIRGMGANGTFRNDGTPQWVFDAGAGFIDEPGPPDGPPRRYPVYWDPVYIEKSANFIAAFGERYNRNPAVEMVFQGFLGHFGEMHLSEHTPIRPWAEAGFTLKRYTAALKHLTGAFKAAFPDKPIFQELGNPSYNTPCPGCGAEPISLVQAKELVPYLVSEGINLKYNGLGANWDRWGSDPFIEGWYVDYCRAYHDRIRLIVENIATFHAPAELETLRRCHASYTNRGGELPGLPECRIGELDDDCFRRMENYDPLGKRHYLDGTRGRPEFRQRVQYDAARIAGYRLLPAELHYPAALRPGETAVLTSYWENRGAAKPHDDFGILYALVAENGETVWESVTAPILPTSTLAWAPGERTGERTELHLPPGLPPGRFRLAVGMRRLADLRPIRLPLYGGDGSLRYDLGPIELAKEPLS